MPSVRERRRTMTHITYRTNHRRWQAHSANGHGAKKQIARETGHEGHKKTNLCPSPYVYLSSTRSKPPRLTTNPTGSGHPQAVTPTSSLLTSVADQPQHSSNVPFVRTIAMKLGASPALVRKRRLRPPLPRSESTPTEKLYIDVYIDPQSSLTRPRTTR